MMREVLFARYPVGLDVTNPRSKDTSHLLRCRSYCRSSVTFYTKRITFTVLGRLAQLGEHLVYTQDVRGSSPLVSTWWFGYL